MEREGDGGQEWQPLARDPDAWDMARIAEEVIRA